MEGSLRASEPSRQAPFHAWRGPRVSRDTPERLTVLVCGSRDWPEDWLWWVDARMIEIAEEHDPAPVHVISGGARGVDKRADACAIRCGFSREVIYADWNAEPRRAGFIRNLAMLDRQPDVVLA